MDTTRWQPAQALFHQAADLPDVERQPFLQRASGEDDSLVSEVMAMRAELAQAVATGSTTTAKR